MIHNLITEIQSTRGMNAKIDLLKTIIGTDHEETMKRVLIYALDGRKNYWITSAEKPSTNTGEKVLDEFLDVLETLATREVTGNAARERVDQALSALSEQDAEIALRVIGRDMKCGLGAKSINKVWPDLIYEHPYMRCSSFSAKNLEKISFPCYSQTKADGTYTDIIVNKNTQTVEYQSRSGEYKMYGSSELRAEILALGDFIPYDHYVIQGEALVKDEDGNIMDRSSGNGILNSDECHSVDVLFDVWDLVEYDVWVGKRASDLTYRTRYSMLETALSNKNINGMTLIETVRVNNVDEVMEHFLQNINKGLEGTVLKDDSGLWKSTTSPHQVKVKVIAEAEFKIVDVLEGEGRNVGRMGAFVVETADGLLRCRVGTGFKDVEREQYWETRDSLLGKIITVRFNDLVKNQDDDSLYALFLPRFIKMRDDKTEADSLDRVREQLGSTKDILKHIMSE